MKQPLDKNIHEGHRKRLRDEFFSHPQPYKLPEHKILEQLLSYAIVRKDVNVLAHTLINHFGSLAQVFDAPKDELLLINGVGESAASLIKFCAMMPEVYKYCHIKLGIKINSTKDAINFIQDNVVVTADEKFYYICLDKNMKIIKFDSLGYGFVNNISINFHEFANLIPKATQVVIVCHTHPNNDATPSNEDKDFTFNLQKLLQSIHMNLLDHIIISNNGYFSFHDKGMLAKENTFDQKFNKLNCEITEIEDDAIYIKDMINGLFKKK